jgi:fluoride exporter
MMALWIGLLGAAGSLARWGLAVGLARKTFPVPTLVVNLVGCLAIGLVAGAVTNDRLRIPLTTGFLGGFTTMSAFSLDAVQLLERRAYGLFAAYTGATIAGCLLACVLGLAAGRALTR